MTTRFADTLRAITVAVPFALGAMSLSSAPAPAATGCNDFHTNKCKIQLSTGITMAYVEVGPEFGTPVILIHGFTDSLHTWSYSGPLISEGPSRMAHSGGRSARSRCQQYASGH